MSFNISDFKAQITNSKFEGLAVSSKHLLELNIPPVLNSSILGGSSYPTASELSFFCDTINIPGKNINTYDYVPDGYGRKLTIPVGRTIDKLTVTLFCDSNRTIHEFFMNWLGIITGSDIAINISGRARHELAYRKEYITDIRIKGFSESGNEKVTYHLFNAYPTQIGGLSTGWEMNDTILKLSVEFTFEELKMVKSSFDIAQEQPVNTQIDLFTRVAQLGTIAGVINSVRRPRSLQDLINLGTTVRTVSRGLRF